MRRHTIIVSALGLALIWFATTAQVSWFAHPATAPCCNNWFGKYRYVLVTTHDDGNRLAAQGYAEALDAHGLTGKMTLFVSARLLDATNKADTTDLNAIELQRLYARGYDIGTQGKFWEAKDEETYYYGFNSWTDADSLAEDVDRAWLADTLAVDESAIVSCSTPFGIYNNQVIRAIRDEGYLINRNNLVFASPPTTAPGSIRGDTTRYFRADSTRSIFSLVTLKNISVIHANADTADDSETWGTEAAHKDTILARFERNYINVSEANGRSPIILVLHYLGGLTQKEYRWIIEYCQARGDVAFANMADLAREIRGRGQFRDPEANSIYALLDSTRAADSIFVRMGPPKLRYTQDGDTARYIFSRHGSAMDSTGYTKINGGMLNALIVPATPTTVFANGTTSGALARGYVLPISGDQAAESAALYYFNCAATLAGMKIVSARLYIYSPNSETNMSAASEALNYYVAVAMNKTALATWIAAGDSDVSYTNYDQSAAAAWNPAWSTYDTWWEMGYPCPMMTPRNCTADNVWYSYDVTPGVQLWADGQPEAGFLISARRAAGSYFSTDHHNMSNRALRPYLRVIAVRE